MSVNMNKEDEIFAMMSIAKQQQNSINTAIVKMTTMAEEITEENQKLFNKNMDRQTEAHSEMMTHVNSILAKRFWNAHLLISLLTFIFICAVVVAITVGYEQHLLSQIYDLQEKLGLLKSAG
jgi:Fe2+ transport system protein B